MPPVRQPQPAPERDQQRPVGHPGRGKHSQRGVLIGVGVAALVISALLLGLLLSKIELSAITGTTELDVNQAQIGVQQVLTDPINGYGRDNVTNVRCNNGVNPTVKAGNSFTCQVSVEGAQRQVTVVFSDDKGTYEVDRPR